MEACRRWHAGRSATPPCAADAVQPTDTHTSRIPAQSVRATTEDQRMSKGMDRKKEQKKKPAKTMKEKKAEKKEKKTGKGFAPV